MLPGSGGRGQDESSIPEVPGKLLHKPGLADTGLTRDQDYLATTGFDLRERFAQAAAGRFASNQGYIEARQRGPGEIRGSGHHRWPPILKGALVHGTGLRQRANAELSLQDGSATLKLTERSATVAGSGVEGDEAAMNVLRELIRSEVTAGIPNGQVIFLPGGMLLDKGGEYLQIATLAISLLLEDPRLELRTASEGEAGQERATVEISCPTERPDLFSTLRELVENDEIGPYALSVEADMVAGSNQEIRFGQDTAQVGEEAGKAAARL